MRFPGATVTVLVALLFAGGTAEAAPTLQATVLKGLASAVKSGRLSPGDAAVDRGVVGRAARAWPRLPAARGNELRAVLADVAAQAPRYNAARASALFGMLATNTSYLGTHVPGPTHQDITDANGVVYRYFPGHGYQFHPLGNVVALNAAVNAHDAALTRRLADALAARGVSDGRGGLLWEYYFGYSGGSPPWTSGMAQAEAAQAFARAAALLGDPSLDRTATAAARTVPRLVRQTSFGPWIRLYSFSSVVVLNAQLQSAISLGMYAGLVDDSDAAALAARLRTSAVNALPSFDTGFWSNYALPGDDSPLEYHLYVVDLLRALARSDSRFAAAAARFDAYTHQPPAFQLGDSRGDGVLFWLSKPSRVTVKIGAGAQTLWLRDGWHRLSVPVGSRAGAYWTHLDAVDYDGNRASVDALPVIRAALAGAAARTPSAAPAPAAPSFAVGAGLDLPQQARTATSVGFGTVRLVVPWQAGETAPPQDVVDALNAIHGPRLVVQLAYTAPDVAIAPFAAALVQAVPEIDDLVVGAPAQSPGGYVAVLGAVRDAVASIGARVSIAGTVSDPAALADLAGAYIASGRTRPIMDELAFRSATPPDQAKLVKALASSFDGTEQPGSTLPVLWDGLGTATKVPAAKAKLYTPDAVAASAVDERSQATTYAAALKAAACQPSVTGVLFDRLADGPAPGAQDGLLYPDGSAKSGVALLKPALDDAKRGTIAVCPGLGARVAPTALTFPTQTAYPHGSRSWSVRLACSRDCLYLVTLDRAGDGAPMLATRGQLAGGRPAATVTLPTLAPPAGTYRFTVRLVARVNPGPLAVARGPTFRVSR